MTKTSTMQPADELSSSPAPAFKPYYLGAVPVMPEDVLPLMERFSGILDETGALSDIEKVNVLDKLATTFRQGVPLEVPSRRKDTWNGL